jgi:hypothetical protein
MTFLSKHHGMVQEKRSVIFYAFLAVYAVVLLYLCKELNIWMDEAYTLDTTSAKYSLTGVIHQSYSFESQPPVYFILLWIWRKISQDVFFARLFSLISVGLAAYYFYRLVQLISATNSSKWLVVLFLLNPFTIWAGLEIRLYAFLLFLSTAAIYYLFKFYIEEQKKYLYLFLITCAVSLYTQYFFAFLIAALVFSLLVFGGWKKCFTLCLYLLPVVLAFLPNIVVMEEQLGMVQSEKDHLSAIQHIGLVLHSPQNVLFGMDSLPFGRWWRLAVLLLLVSLLGFAYVQAYKKNKMAPSRYFARINFILLSAVTVVAILSVFIAVTGIDHQDRYLTIALPFFILAFTLFSAHSFMVSRVMYASVAIYFTALIFNNYSDPVKQYDYKKVAGYAETNARPGEPILFYHSTISLPFMNYYNGSNPIRPLPHEVHFDNSYMDNIKDTMELKNAMESISTTSNSYLLISDLNLPRYKNNPDRVMVNNYLASHYNITLDTLYFGASKQRALRLRRLEKK